MKPCNFIFNKYQTYSIKYKMFLHYSIYVYDLSESSAKSLGDNTGTVSMVILGICSYFKISRRIFFFNMAVTIVTVTVSEERWYCDKDIVLRFSSNCQELFREGHLDLLIFSYFLLWQCFGEQVVDLNCRNKAGWEFFHSAEFFYT